MPNYQKMYAIAFNAISDALEELDKLNIGAAKERLREAQFHTEKIYISQDEEDPAREGNPPGSKRRKRAPSGGRGPPFRDRTGLLFRLFRFKHRLGAGGKARQALNLAGNDDLHGLAVGDLCHGLQGFQLHHLVVGGGAVQQF